MSTCSCGNTVSTLTTSCPRCGKTFLGKAVLAGIMIVGILAMVAALCMME